MSALLQSAGSGLGTVGTAVGTGLGGLLNTYAMLRAARAGIGPTQFGQLQQEQALQNQQRLLALPAMRALALQSPEVRQQTITEGPQGPTAQAYGLMGPRVPDDATVQRLQAAGQLDPIEAAQVQRWRQSGLEVGAPGDLPPPALTNDAADRAYKQAQVEEMQRRAQFMQQFLGGGTLQGPNGMQPRSSSYDATTGRLTINSEVPQVRQVDPGTLRPDGKPYQPGDTGPRGEPIEVKPVRGAGTGAIQIGAQIKRIGAALQQVDQIMTRGKDGKRAIDVLPNFSEGASGSVINQIPGGNMLARSGVLGALPVPGGNFGDAYLRNIANDKNNPDAPKATQILAMRGAIVNIVKAFGDAANIADAEQERLIQAFLPAFGNSPDAGGSAEEKLLFLRTSLENIQKALASGQVKTAGELRNALSQTFGTPLGARGTDDPKYRDDAAPIAEDAPAAPGPGAKAAPGTSYDPAQTAKDLETLGLGGPQ